MFTLRFENGPQLSVLWFLCRVLWNDQQLWDAHHCWKLISFYPWQVCSALDRKIIHWIFDIQRLLGTHNCNNNIVGLFSRKYLRTWVVDPIELTQSKLWCEVYICSKPLGTRWQRIRYETFLVPIIIDINALIVASQLDTVSLVNATRKP